MMANWVKVIENLTASSSSSSSSVQDDAPTEESLPPSPKSVSCSSSLSQDDLPSGELGLSSPCNNDDDEEGEDSFSSDSSESDNDDDDGIVILPSEPKVNRKRIISSESTPAEFLGKAFSRPIAKRRTTSGGGERIPFVEHKREDYLKDCKPVKGGRSMHNYEEQVSLIHDSTGLEMTAPHPFVSRIIALMIANTTSPTDKVYVYDSRSLLGVLAARIQDLFANFGDLQQRASFMSNLSMQKEGRKEDHTVMSAIKLSNRFSIVDFKAFKPTHALASTNTIHPDISGCSPAQRAQYFSEFTHIICTPPRTGTDKSGFDHVANALNLFEMPNVKALWLYAPQTIVSDIPAFEFDCQRIRIEIPSCTGTARSLFCFLKI